MPAKNTKFKEGQSGNPRGRPKLPETFKQFAKDKSIESIQMLYDMMTKYDVEDSIKIKCAEIIISYGIGKPTQAIDMTMDNEIKVSVIYE